MKILSKLLVMISTLLLSGLIETNVAKAATVTTTDTEWYWDRHSSTYWGSDRFKFFYVDGVDAFCLEPTTHEGSPVYESDLEHSNVPSSVWNRIKLIGYYGYNYPGHQTLKYRAATQGLMWSAIAGGDVTYWSYLFAEGRQLDITAEENEIERLISAHYYVPSFDNKIYNVMVGETLVLEDTNNVLSNYNVEVTGASYSISGNKLTIVPTMTGIIDISLTKKQIYSTPYKIFISEHAQNQMIVGNIDPVTSTVRIKSYQGKVSITKKDSETGVAQGSATLEGAVFGIYRASNDELVTTITTDRNGYATSGNVLSMDSYYLKEITNPSGYLINNQKYPFTINGEQEVNIEVNEDVIKGRIKILKQDSETNSCLSQYESTLSGAIYEIINSNNVVVDTLTIGSDCTATSKYLPYGKYKVKEKISSTGYLLDTNTYDVNVNSSDIVINVTSKENVIKGRIKILKQDSETNSCSAQYESTLSGAIYEIINSSNVVVDTLTIGSDCTATSKYLPYGKYKVKEKTSSTGYLLDTNTYDVNVNSSDIVINVTSKENVIKGRIKILKQDSETNSCLSQYESTLSGAIYEIINSNNVVVDTLTIGSDCTATSKYLPYGKYKVKEKTSSIGYLLDTNTYDVNVNSNDIVINVTSKEDVKKSRVKVTKLDSETNSCVAQGQATLFSAKYHVLDKDDNVVDILTIGDDCTATSKLLPYGHYKIKEVEQSVGYEIDNNIYNFNITENGLTYEITSYEKVIKNFISILKQYDFVDGNTTFLNAEKDITFEIFYSDGRKYGEVKTDKNGYATLEIPYGIWKFHQVNTNIGFEKIYDFYITVDENSEKEQYYNILNNKLSAYLQVFKVDEETGNTIAIADTTFKILNTDTNQYVSQYVGGLVYSNFKTDENGKFITYLKLEAGNYKLVEISSPKNYLINDLGLNFTIGDDTHYAYTNYGPIVTIRFSDKVVKGQVEVHKKGEVFTASNGTFNYDEKMDLAGIVYNIYANEDIKSADENYLYYEKDTLVDTITTDEFGYAISKKLPLGKYYIVEIETNENFVLDSTKYEFTLSQIDNKTEIVYSSHNILNKLKKGSALFTKNDFVDDAPISNVLMELYTENDELIFSDRTDENGNITINDLKLGKYYFLEKEAPIGYLLNEDKLWFEINENGEIVKSSLKDERVLGTIKIQKNGESYSIDNTCEDDTCFIYETSNNLEGVHFGLYAQEDIILNNIKRYSKGDLVIDGYTDESGKLTFDNLYLGKYYIKELDTLDEYVLDTNEYEVILEYIDGKTPVIEKQIELNNYLKKSDFEFTKYDISDDLPLPNTKMEVYTNDDELIFSGYTDSEGKIILKNMPVGSYYFLEVEAPEGYILNEGKMYFEIKENGEIVKSSLKDERILGTIKIQKNGESYSIDNTCENDNCFIYETINNLEGVHFGLYAGEDIILNNIKRYSKDELIIDGYTDESGELIFDSLYLGKYYIKELDTFDKYVLDTNEYDFVIEYIDGKTPIIEKQIELKNYLKKSDFEFTKLDVSNDEPLPNTLIEIYTTNDELIFSGYTDEEGKIILKDIPFGKYYFLEKEAPEGFTLNEEKMYFEIIENGEVVKSNLKDSKIKSKIVIYKKDGNNNLLAGVKIGIFDTDDNLIFEGITNENGLIETELEYGKYYWKELEALKNYVLSDEKIYFEVTEDGAVIENTLINIEVPNTLANTYINFVGGIIVIIGLSFILISNINNRKK